MKKIGITALAAGIVVAFSPMAHAQTDPSGFLCGFASVTDPQVEGSQTGEMDGGPLVLTDDTDPTKVVSGSLTCEIRVGTNDTYAEPYAARASGPYTTGVVSLPPTTVTYEVGPDEPVWMCTTVEVDTDGDGDTDVHLYFDYGNDSWSTDPNVQCSLAISAETPDPSPVDSAACSVFHALPEPAHTTLETLWGCLH